MSGEQRWTGGNGCKATHRHSGEHGVQLSCFSKWPEVGEEPILAQFGWSI